MQVYFLSVVLQIKLLSLSWFYCQQDVLWCVLGVGFLILQFALIIGKPFVIQMALISERLC